MDERQALETWALAVAEALGTEPIGDIDAMLDLVRSVAHGVQRPAGPLAAYLIGVAVGSGTRSCDDAIREVLALATTHGTGSPPP